MIYFNNDYAEGCHPKVLEALIKTNMEQTPGYDSFSLQGQYAGRPFSCRRYSGQSDGH